MSGINEDIIKMIRGRLEKGRKEYKQEVQDDDKRDFLIEALEEVLDSQVYLAAEILKIKKLRDASSDPI
jgi:hypothetical protein